MSLLSTTIILCILVAIAGITPTLYYKTNNYKQITFRLLHTLLSYRYKYLPLYNNNDNRDISNEYRAFEQIVNTTMPKGKITFTNNTMLHVNVTRSRISSMLASYNTIDRNDNCRIQQYNIIDNNNNNITTYFIYGNNNIQSFNDNSNQPLVIYLHGGYYMSGSIISHSDFECEFSNRLNIPLLHVEYSLVPEHRLPTAVHETVDVYKHLINKYNDINQRIVIAGDSAGL